MKTKFIETGKKSVAQEKAPWAAKLVKVEGGYLAFESVTDYTIWKNQK